MQIVSWGDNLHEMSKPFSSTEIFTHHAKHKNDMEIPVPVLVWVQISAKSCSFFFFSFFFLENSAWHLFENVLKVIWVHT